MLGIRSQPVTPKYYPNRNEFDPFIALRDHMDNRQKENNMTQNDGNASNNTNNNRERMFERPYLQRFRSGGSWKLNKTPTKTPTHNNTNDNNNNDNCTNTDVNTPQTRETLHRIDKMHLSPNNGMGNRFHPTSKMQLDFDRMFVCFAF